MARRSLRRRFAFVFTAAAAAAPGISPLLADVKIWGGGSGAWDFTQTNFSGLQFVNGDEAVFNSPAGTVTVSGGPVAPLRLSFNANGYIVNGDSLTLGAGAAGSNVTVSAGNFARIDSLLSGTNGLSLFGGGSLLLSNPQNTLTGNITVDGANSLLFVRPMGIPVGASRGDALGLGSANSRTITLTNGGGIRVIGNGWNPDSATKSLVLGAGGSVISVAAGYNQYTIEDASQISAAVSNPSINKTGAGRLTLGGQDYLLPASLVVNAGVVDFARLNAGSGTAGTRFSALAIGGTITVNGGIFTGNNGTVGVIDSALTLNAGGAIAVQGADHEYGTRATTGHAPIVLNGGTILSREAFTPQTSRQLRVNGLLSGSGTIDVVGASGTGTSRVIFQGGGLAHSFNGTFRILNNTVLESTPRYGLNNNNGASLPGSAIGSAANLELAGFNAGIDLREDGGTVAGTAATGTVLLSWGNNLNISTTVAGARNSINVQNAVGTGARNNTFTLGTVTVGGQWLSVTGNGGNDLRINTLNLTGSPVVDVVTAGIDVNVVNAISSAQSLAKMGNGTLQFLNSTNLANLNVRSGTVELQGAAGAITGGTVTVNGGGVGNPNAGVLLLNNNTAATGTTAANNANRLADTVPVVMLANSTLRLSSVNNGTASETTGNITTSFGNPTFDVTVNGTPTAPVVLTLGTAALTRGANTVVQFTGTGTNALIGTAGNTARITLPGQTASTFLGGWAVVGNDFAKYDTTVDTGVALGVTPLSPFEYEDNPADDAVLANSGFQPGYNVRLTAVDTVTPEFTTLTMVASRTIQSLNINLAAAIPLVPPSTIPVDVLDLNGTTMTLSSGGLLISGGNAANIDRSSANPGVLTAGTTSAAASLFVTTVASGEIGSRITNNAAGGAVTLVKSGAGSLSLTNTASANTFSGGVVVNAGTLNVWRLGQLGPATNTITLAGGMLNATVPGGTVASPLNNSTLAGGGHNVVVRGNSVLAADNNGETAGAGSNNTISLGSLTITADHYFGIGGSDNYDFRFTSASFTGRPTINLGINRGGEAIIAGAQSGSGFDVVAFSGTAGAYTLGGGVADGTANTYSGAINLYGGTLRMNKANGVNAVTGNVVINGGTLAWGPGGNLNNTTGLAVSGGTLPSLAAGRDQIVDSASITLLSGSLGVVNAVQQETFASLTQRNGTFNVGIGTLNIGSYTVSGGALVFSSGGSLVAGTMVVESGGPHVDVSNNFTGAKATLQIGSGGLSLRGQDVTLAAGTAAVPAQGGTLVLGGNVTVATDPLSAGSYNRGILVGAGRELATNTLDLSGGNRTFDIAGDAFFRISPRVINGGIVKNGAGVLSVQNFSPSTFAGPVTINQGVLLARSGTALGTSAGGVTIASGATLKVDSVDAGAVIGDAIAVGGHGAVVAGTDGNVMEQGAIVGESGTTTFSGAVALTGSSTFAANASQFPTGSTAPLFFSTLRFTSAAGVGGTGSLTLDGLGNGSIAGDLTFTGGLTKVGGGTWTIGGNGNYAGPTVVAGGTLVVSGSGGLGSSAGGTTVLSGGSLRLIGTVNSADAISLTAVGRPTPLYAASGTHNLSGVITLATDATIRSDGSLTLSGGVTAMNRALTLAGAGTGSVTAPISTGDAALLKVGGGAWSLSGANTFTGATTVSGGTLTLDYTGGGSRLSPTAALSVGGGAVHFTGGGSQSVTQLNVGVGGATVTASGAAVDVGPINRTAGASADFGTSGGGSINTSNSLSNGLLGGWATFNGTDFATLSAGNVVAFSGYTALPSATASTADNRVLSATQTQTGSVTANSLKIAGGGFLNLGGNNLTLSSGGLLVATGGNYVVGGTGAIAGSSSANDLIVHVSSGTTVDLATPVIGGGAGGLVKAGPGTLILNAISTFTGNISVNAGTLAMAGGDGLLGSNPASPGKLITVANGATFRLVTGDYDPGTNSKRFAIGAGGGTLDVANGVLTLTDTGQFAGSAGTFTKAGGGRLRIGNFDNSASFTGDVVVTGGALQIDGVNALGGANGGTIILGGGSTFINAGGALSHPFVLNGSGLYNSGGDRAYSGTFDISGNSTLGLVERDNFSQNRSMTLFGRISGSGSIRVPGSNNASLLNLYSSGNDFAGAYNLTANAAVEVRMPGALGSSPGQVTVNLNGANSRLVFRHYLDGDYKANVHVGRSAEISIDRTTNAVVGTNQIISINSLSVASTAQVVNVTGGNGYTLRVAGSAAVAGSPLLNVTGNLALENGATFSTAGATFDKRGAGTLSTMAPLTHSGPTVVRGGTLWLRGAGTSPLLPNTSGVQLRGGTLTVDHADGSNRIADSTPVLLGGGTLRVSGAEAFGTVTAPTGTTSVVFNPGTLNNLASLTLTGFTAPSGGASINFASDTGTVGGVTAAASVPRIFLDNSIATDQPILGWAVVNNADLAMYLGATTDQGAKRGVTAVTAYTNDPAETAFDATTVANLTGTSTTTLTAPRTLRGVRLSGGATRQLALAGNNLVVASGAILHTPNNATRISGAAGVLTAGTENSLNQLTVTVAQNTMIWDVATGDNGSPVALVKAGGGTLSMRGGADAYGVAGITTYNSSFPGHTGGTYVNAGTLEAFRTASVGSGTLTLAGGTLLYNVPLLNPASGVTGNNNNIAGGGNNIVVNGDSALNADNNGEFGATAPSGQAFTTDNNIQLGSLTIHHGATLALAASDSYDFAFNGATFAGTPTLDMTFRDINHTTTIAGGIAGSGFNVASTGTGTGAQWGSLEIGGGASDTVANTFTGAMTVLAGGTPTIRLNKAAGVNAVSGDLIINGGAVALNAAEQIADTSTVSLNGGVLNLYTTATAGLNETVHTLNMDGGEFNTGTGAAAAPTFTATSINIRGGSGTNGFAISGAAGAFGGRVVATNLSVTDFGKIVISGTSATATTGLPTLDVANLTMGGTTIFQASGTTSNEIILRGSLTTTASEHSAVISNADADNFLTLEGAQTFDVADGVAVLDLVVQSILRDGSAPGGFTKTGAGTLMLNNAASANNTYTGLTAVNDGVLALGRSNSTNRISIPGNLTIGDGVGAPKSDVVRVLVSEQIANTSVVTIGSTGLLDLQTVNASETIGALNMSAGGVVDMGPNTALTITSAADNSTVAGEISGHGAVTKQGAASLTYAAGAVITYSGLTTLSAGTLSIAADLSGAPGGITTASGTTLNVNHDAGLGTGLLTINGGTLGNTSGSARAVSTATPQRWTANFGFAGPSALNLGTGTVTLTATPTITISASTLTVGGNISGAFGISKSGTGTLALAGPNSFTGAATISAGTLRAQNASALGTTAGSTTVSSGGHLAIDNVNIGGEALSLAGNGVSSSGALSGTGASAQSTGAITLSATTGLGAPGVADVLTLTGSVSGTAGVNKFGSGTVVLGGTAANTYSGLTNILAGTLDLNKTVGVNAIVGDGISSKVNPDVLVNGGTLRLQANDQLANSVYVSMSSGTFNLNGKTEAIYYFVNAGGTYTSGRGGGLTILDPLWSSGANHIFGNDVYGGGSGPQIDIAHEISGGLNMIHGAEGFASAGSVTVGSSHSILQFSGSTPNLTINSDRPQNGVNPAQPGRLILAGNINVTTGTQATITSGPALRPDLVDDGIVVIDVDPDQSGAISGKVELGSAIRAFNVEANASLAISAVVQGSGGLTKTGPGLLTLAAGNTYNGPTTIAAGTLAVNGVISSATEAIAAGTLAGSGSITEAVSIRADGAIRPGASAGSSIGILTVKSLSMANDTKAVIGIDISGTVAGSGYDQIALPNAATSVVTLTGSSLAVKLGTLLAGDGSEKFVIVNNASPTAGTVTGTFANLIVEASPAFGVPADNTLTSPTVNANGGYQFTDANTGFIYTLLYNVDSSAGNFTPGSGNDVVLSVVPEPGSLALAAMAGLGLLSRRRRRA